MTPSRRPEPDNSDECSSCEHERFAHVVGGTDPGFGACGVHGCPCDAFWEPAE